jgi:hypothetical protein
VIDDKAQAAAMVIGLPAVCIITLSGLDTWTVLQGLDSAAAEYTEGGDCADCRRQAVKTGDPYAVCEDHANDIRKAGDWLEVAAQISVQTGVAYRD